MRVCTVICVVHFKPTFRPIRGAKSTQSKVFPSIGVLVTKNTRFGATGHYSDNLFT